MIKKFVYQIPKNFVLDKNYCFLDMFEIELKKGPISPSGSMKIKRFFYQNRTAEIDLNFN